MMIPTTQLIVKITLYAVPNLLFIYLFNQSVIRRMNYKTNTTQLNKSDEYTFDSKSSNKYNDQHIEESIVEFEEFIHQRQNAQAKTKKKIPSLRMESIKELDQYETNQYPKFKQPPVPKGSMKSNKVFVFPNEKIDLEINNDPSETQNEINYLRETIKRQQKELSIKQGQIQMMQKILSEQLNKKNKDISFDSTEKVKRHQEIRIQELTNKIEELTLIIKNKNAEIIYIKNENVKLMCNLQNVKHELYLAKMRNQVEISREQNLSVNRQNILNAKQQTNLTELRKNLDNLVDTRIENLNIRTNNREITPERRISQTTTNKNKVHFDFQPKYQSNYMIQKMNRLHNF